MRIIGGQYRGTVLATVGVGDNAAHLRPTPDRVRESLFNILESNHGEPTHGARVLDLFAGTGALGFEALSRGAAHCTFVDDGTAARALIRENMDKTRTVGTTKLYRRDATRLGPNHGAPFSLVFLDPPYGMGLGAAALTSAITGGWLSDRALVVWEENAAQAAPAGFVPEDARRYGDTHITILRRKADTRSTLG